MKRKQPKVPVGGEGGLYFDGPKTHLSFIPSGSKLLDLALGGGWAEGRVANIIGDKSTGKTLLAIEASANFARKYTEENCTVFYRESEAAFDVEYAKALGMPMKRVDLCETLETVEDFYEDLQSVIETAKYPSLYILDSLDALSDRAEMSRNLDEGTYGAGKAKQLSQVFRRSAAKMAKAKVTLMVISQVRDAIGVMFGRKFKRSGGRAMDFYASQVVILSQMGHLDKTISGITNAVGIDIKAKVDKNKIGLPFREARFSIMFGYGVDDLQSCLDWLAEAGSLEILGLTKEQVKHGQGSHSKYVKGLAKLSDAEYRKTTGFIYETLEKRWYEVESSFLPKRRKYA